MKTSDFSIKITSKKLNESLFKQFGTRIDIENYSRTQLEDYRNLIRTELSQTESSSKVNDLLSNESYQRNRQILELLNVRIKELAEDRPIVSEGAKVDRMVKHIKASEIKAGKSPKEAEKIAWATANKRGMLSEISSEKLKSYVDRAKGINKELIQRMMSAASPEEVDTLYKKLKRHSFDKIAGAELKLDQKTQPDQPATEEHLYTMARNAGSVEKMDTGEWAGTNDAGSQRVFHSREQAEKFSKNIAEDLSSMSVDQLIEYARRIDEGFDDSELDSHFTDPKKIADVVKNLEANPPEEWQHYRKFKQNIFVNPREILSAKNVINLDEALAIYNLFMLYDDSGFTPEEKEWLSMNKVAAYRLYHAVEGRKSVVDRFQAPVKQTTFADRAREKGQEIVSKFKKMTNISEQGNPMKTKLSEQYSTIIDGLRRMINEDEEGKAKDITAGTDIVNDFTSWMQRVGQYQTKTMIELADSIRSNFGQEAAEQFKTAVQPALQSTLDALTQSREQLTRAVAVLAGEETAEEPMGAEVAAPEEPEEAGDEFAASDAAAGGTEQAGRELREGLRSRIKRLAESHSIMNKLSK